MMLKWILVITVFSQLFCTIVVGVTRRGISPIKIGGGTIFHVPPSVPEMEKIDVLYGPNTGDTGRSQVGSSNVNQYSTPKFRPKIDEKSANVW